MFYNNVWGSTNHHRHLKPPVKSRSIYAFDEHSLCDECLGKKYTNRPNLRQEKMRCDRCKEKKMVSVFLQHELKEIPKKPKPAPVPSARERFNIRTRKKK